jgi:hypothetical protein
MRGRATALIHRQLDRQQQLRHPLHLIDHRPIEAAKEALGILAGSGGRGGVVEGEIGALIGRELPHQRGLAALARPVQQNHGGIGQALLQAPGDAPGPDRLREHGCGAADSEACGG